ncbi:MAG: hypothetical protein GX149_05950 [Acholeplasmataceae bacterium]|jgi:hypothetical protein|nr:hypothetical protein [Acholeplasmataceae bacterium]
MTINISKRAIFVKNELGNIEVRSSDGKKLKGFLNHLELYLRDFDYFNLQIDSNLVLQTKNLYVYLRHQELKEEHFILILNYLKIHFINAEIFFEERKFTSDLIIVDLFLYE